MEKNVFFSEETIQNVERICRTEDGKTLVAYGQGNFKLGVAAAAGLALSAYGIYRAGRAALGLAAYTVKYFRLKT